MDTAGAMPLFVDTGAFYARFDESAARHDSADALFRAIGRGERPFRPIYTSTYVLDELATLVVSRHTHATAVTAIDRIRQSATKVVHPDESDFDATCEQFARYDDHDISFTDHMTGVLADDRDIDHVFTFDADHFRTLGFTVVPEDVGG